MAKPCNEDDCSNPIWSTKKCKFHQNKRTDDKWIRSQQKSKVSVIKKKGKSFKPLSDKRAEELAIYRPLRDKYLKDNPICEVKECYNDTTNLHHKNGRLGKMVYNTEYFMACCGSCHPGKIHEDPAWARENGYLI